MKTIRLQFMASVLALAALSGCASPTPHLDSKFGQAVNAAKAQQTIDRDAGTKADASTGDGATAKEAIDRYRESYKSPPPATSIINIGIGSGGR